MPFTLLDFGTNCMIGLFPESRTWYFRGIGLSFLRTAASGTGTTAIYFDCPPPGLTFGRGKSSGTAKSINGRPTR
ncbi:hypothetical protein MPLDJ20_230103 [Mesorhizobium plurifarium]|uniref:Uncharacterized protein n=1 Tax=Mesorhizobium plurifarium TaxID=69974 RepID=A0A090F444_MESPL|nr:hypothetical protein MPLDJ20_230103 [Mesorhizobium plurifarium]